MPTPLIKTLLDNLLTVLKHPTFWVVAIITIIAVGYYRQSAEIQSLHEKDKQQVKELTTAQDDLNRAVVIIERNKEALEENQEALDTLEVANKQIEEKLNDTKSKLDSYRSREHIAAAKPALVESRANAATQRMFHDLACSTGDSRYCGDEAGTTYTFDRTGD